LLRLLGVDATEWPQWDQGRWPALSARLEELFAGRTLDGWRDALEGTDACFAPVLRVDEAVAHPHVAARGTYVERDGVLQPSPSPRFGRTPGAIQGRPPLPGEHTDEILAELGTTAGRSASA
jgi:alpha-methylacyl-CoA racemase